MQALYARVNSLDDPALDAHRYYAFGLVSQEMHRRLGEPGVRRSLVNEAARDMAATFLEKDELAEVPGLRTVDIPIVSGVSTDSFNRHFVDLAARACDRLPEGVRLLTDTLEQIASERLAAVDHPESRTPDDYAGEYSIGSIMEDKPAAERVGVTTTSGPMVLVRHAVEARQSTAPCNSPADAVMRSDQLRGLRLRKVGTLCAGLRVDEFSRRFDELTSFDSTGRATFHRELVPAVPPPQPPGLLHSERLGCPALAAPGLIPGMLGMVPEIIENTQARIAHQRQRDAAD
jgi:hypothetical protein